MRNYRAYVAELIGTFFLVLTVGTAVLSQNALAPLGIGAVLLAMVYAGGHISGAHYNPAVTIAALVRRRISVTDAVVYWVVQIVAGLLAGGLAYWIVNPANVDTLTPTGRDLAVALVVEALFTFALAFVVLNVATSKDHPVNSFYGLAIGFTVAAGAVAVGGISGAVFNPAVGLGVAAVGLIHFGTIWLYVLVQLAAGAVAGLVFPTLNPGELPEPAPREVHADEAGAEVRNPG